jgi:adenylate cyclase
MHIIFDASAKAELEQKHIVLELDTMVLPNQPGPVTAYCVVEQIPFQELSIVDKLQAWHQELMQAYKARDWDGCLQGIARLKGQWGGRIDSFYDILHDRIKGYKEQEPGPDWDGILRK